ncbi:MAG: DUF5615 family PIN-like protein [Planctomycetes bacterium]|nr:DUF5615 family PIN-like protein [Planctomycetota bacterium]
MDLLLDQGVPRGAASLLRADGHEVVHVADVGHAASPDDVILAVARSTGRVVVTLDADFHALLAASGARSPSVIRIRIEGLRAREMVDVVREVILRCGSDLRSGAAVSVRPGRIGVRSLPLVGRRDDPPSPGIAILPG